MNTRLLNITSMILLTLALGMGTGCSMDADYSQEASYGNSIPPKNSSEQVSPDQNSAEHAGTDGAADGSTGENEIPDKPEDEVAQFWIQFSTDDSTSMASPQLFKAGQYGGLPHEFVNYYDPPASMFEEETWSIEEDVNEDIRLGLKTTEAQTITRTYPCGEDGSDQGFEVVGEQECTEEKEVVDVLFQMRADAVPQSERRNWNLFFCVDVSGSMTGDNLLYAKRALEKSLDNLKTGDRVTMVTFNSQAVLHFEDLEFTANEETIRNAFDNLEAGGGTDMRRGLNLTYELAQALYNTDHTNRVILFSDGAANVGDTRIAGFEALTRIGGNEGIYLSGVGVGHYYDMERMDALTDAGKGAHVFLPSIEEVDLIFGDYFSKLVEVSADQVAIEMMLPEGLALEGFSGEEVSVDPEQRLQNIILAAGDDMTFTARFVVHDEAALDGAASLKVTLRPLSSGEEQIIEIEIDKFSDLIADPGVLFERTQLVSDFAKYATGHNGATRTLEELEADLEALDNPDWGLAEIEGYVSQLQ